MKTLGRWGFFAFSVVVFGTLNFFFVNCSRSYTVSDGGEVMATKPASDVSSSSSNSSSDPIGQGGAPTTDDGDILCPPQSTDPECMLDDDVDKLPTSKDADSDIDKIRKKFCAVFDIPGTADAPDMNINDESGKRVLMDAVGSLSVHSFRGLLLVKHANHITMADDIRGATILSSPEVDQVNNHRGLLSLSSSTVTRISDYRGGLCVGAKQIEEISNGRGLTVVMGPESGRATLETIDDIRGKMLLVNVDVKSLGKFKGVIFVKNSSIAGPIDPQVKVIEIKK